MQHGENDVLSFSVEVIVRDILALASYIHSGLGATRVIIGHLLRRQPWASSLDLNERNCYKRPTAGSGIIDGGNSFLAA